MVVTEAIRAFIGTGPIAHVVTLDADGGPQVSLAWVGLDADEIAMRIDRPESTDDSGRDHAGSVS